MMFSILFDVAGNCTPPDLSYFKAEHEDYNTIMVIKPRIRWAVHVPLTGAMRNAYKILRCIREDNIEYDGVVYWTHLLEDRDHPRALLKR
jgi:hypothetical protein